MKHRGHSDQYAGVSFLKTYFLNLKKGKGEGRDPTNMFKPATLFMYVPVPSQKPVIQCTWLSIVYVLHCLFVHFLY